MLAIVFDGVGRPLRAEERDPPTAGPGQLLLRVRACGVCRTDLHLMDGEVDVPAPPRVLGHQIVATVGDGDERVGVPWLGWTCGECRYCTSGRENLCPRARFTGRDIDGGMAEYAVADERYCFPLPDGPSDVDLAPLLCAGLIGYRCLTMCGDAPRVGLYGFGAAAHIIAQVLRWQGREVYAFTSPGDDAAQGLARELGAAWAGGSDERPPAGARRGDHLRPGRARWCRPRWPRWPPAATVVLGGIHMSDIPAMPYELLWHERSLRSVANLTRRDGEEFLALAGRAGVRTHVTTYPLERAGEALDDLRAGRFTGAGVLVPPGRSR